MDSSGQYDHATPQILGQIKTPFIVATLRFSVFLCLAMSIMLLVDKVYMAIVVSFVKVFGRKANKQYKWEALHDDAELGNTNYPMVLVQIPMYNEREVSSHPHSTFNIHDY